MSSSRRTTPRARGHRSKSRRSTVADPVPASEPVPESSPQAGDPPRRLRVGVLVDGDALPAFQAAMLESIAASSSSSLVFIGVERRSPGDPPRGPDPLFRVYRWLDRRLLGG